MKSLLGSLTNGQKLSIVATILAVAGGLYWFIHWTAERDFKPLYSGVTAEDAGSVLAKLKEAGVEYRVTDGGSTILVHSAHVAETRLQLAAQGLPKSGRIGFELFDKANFGVTDFAEQVNYHRALEGELERSVMALAEVESARVHITFPKNSIFAESRQEAKASVMVKLRSATRLPAQNILAITHLVASAVEGLRPESVSLLDMQGNLLSRPHKSLSEDGQDLSDAALDYRQRIEKDLVAKVNSTLEPILGPDNFRTSASVECDFTGGEQSEETFDPSKSVMVTSQKTEDIAGATVTGGVPGSASNLPRPASRPSSTGNGVTRRTENVTYQSSRLVRRIHLPQGTVKRLSVSVLVDQAVRWEGSGTKARRIIEPPAPERMKVIRDLVAGIVGLQEDRGDQHILESLPFEGAVSSQPPAIAVPVGAAPKPDLNKWVQDTLREKSIPVAIGAAATLLLLLTIVIMFRRRGRKHRVEMQRQISGAPVEHSAVEDARKVFEGKMAEQQAIKERQELEALAALKMPAVKTQKTEILSKHLTTETQKDPMAIAHILRAWLNER
jgi:flagellar M-ring protein FliF